jgi:hypothetical protein
MLTGILQPTGIANLSLAQEFNLASFRGDPKRLTKELYPAICDWATELIQRSSAIEDLRRREQRKPSSLQTAALSQKYWMS